MKDDECFFCGEDGALDRHHIIPKRYGGPDTDDNLVTLCPTCHAKIERKLYNKKFYEEITDLLSEPSCDYWTWVEMYRTNPEKFNKYMSCALRSSDIVALSTTRHNPHFRENAHRFVEAFNEHYPNFTDIRKSEMVKIFELSDRYRVVMVERDESGFIGEAVLRFNHDDLFWVTDNYET